MKMKKKKPLSPEALNQRRRAGASWSPARRAQQAERMKRAHALARSAETVANKVGPGL
jgi:hypothetical protein